MSFRGQPKVVHSPPLLQRLGRPRRHQRDAAANVRVKRRGRRGRNGIDIPAPFDLIGGKVSGGTDTAPANAAFDAVPFGRGIDGIETQLGTAVEGTETAVV